MTRYQHYTRLKHIIKAKHWRGAAIHSPAMYEFIRTYAIKNRKRKLIEAIDAPVVSCVYELIELAEKFRDSSFSEPKQSAVILKEPFKNRAQKRTYEKWYAQNHAVTIHFQGLIVIFFDKKLQKQRFLVRN